MTGFLKTGLFTVLIRSIRGMLSFLANRRAETDQ